MTTARSTGEFAQADDATFGKYRLLYPLTQGGMAELFVARQEGPAGFAKSVVIKRVLRHLSEDTEFVEMFLDEARLAAQLNHPNVVQIFDFGEVDGSYFLCMEHLAGEDLATILRTSARKQQRLPPQICASIVSAACDALHYAHTLCDEGGRPLNIVHRDVSPSNIYVTFRGVTKVLDFGIAKAEGKLTQTRAGIVKGKFPYMSPEQARGQPLDARSDVWALGVVLHEMLTGLRLFSRDNDLAVLKAVTEDAIPRPSERYAPVPRELDDIVMKALERDVSRRYESAQQMHADLEEFLATRSSQPNQVQKFMVELFGEEHIQKKARPPSLSSPGMPAVPGSGPKSGPLAAGSGPKSGPHAPGSGPRSGPHAPGSGPLARPPSNPSGRNRLPPPVEGDVEEVATSALLVGDAPTQAATVSLHAPGAKPKSKTPLFAALGGAAAVAVIGAVVLLGRGASTPAAPPASAAPALAVTPPAPAAEPQ
ncbi:MAG: serine/threonine protein kinase, partial [Myxococcales bacterium]